MEDRDLEEKLGVTRPGRDDPDHYAGQTFDAPPQGPEPPPPPKGPELKP